MKKEPSRRAALITISALLAVALYLIWEMTARYLSGIFLGVVLGISGLPIYYRLQRWQKPGLAAAAATLVIMLLAMGPVLFLAVTVASEAQGMYQTMAASSQFAGRVAGLVRESHRPADHTVGASDGGARAAASDRR